MKKINLLASFCVGVFGLFAASVAVVEASSPSELIAKIDVFSDKLGEIERVKNIPDRMSSFNEQKQLRLEALGSAKQKIINDITADLIPFVNNDEFMSKMLFAWSFFSLLPKQPASKRRECMIQAATYLTKEYYNLYGRIMRFFGQALPEKSQKLLDLIFDKQVDEVGTAAFIRYMVSCLNPTYVPKLRYSDLFPILFDVIGDFAAQGNNNSSNIHIKSFQREISAYLCAEEGVNQTDAERCAAVYSVILGQNLIERLHRNEPDAVSEAHNKVIEFVDTPFVEQQGNPQIPASQQDGNAVDADSGTATRPFIESVFGISALIMNSGQNTRNQNNTGFRMSFFGEKK